MICSLCSFPDTTLFYRWIERGHDYLLCPNCGYIFLSPVHHLDPLAEKKVYDFHENDPSDLAYINFLNQLVIPLKKYIHSRGEFSKGLDFGCGPGPTLHLLLEEEGLKMDIYDPLYYPNEELLLKSYDVVTCSEVFEHFKDPMGDFTKLYNALRPGGILGVMTEFFHEGRDFPNWHYIKYHTHVGFFSTNTLSWLARRFNMEVDFIGDRVAIFKKSEPFSL
ncbi:MAG: class I SAM-dependent methyltransferase [Bacteriovoracales bacterium]